MTRDRKRKPRDEDRKGRSLKREREEFGPRASRDAKRSDAKAEHERAQTARARTSSHNERDERREPSDRVYGVSPVLEVLRANARPIDRITIVEGAHESRFRELFEIARERRIPVRRAPRAELQRIAGEANHQGVIAQVAAARYASAEELLDALAARVGTEEEPLALALDGVEDPRNLGAIIRTAECAGAHGVFVPERRAAGLTETAAKASAGALEYVKVARATNLARLQEDLKERGVWTVGAAAEGVMEYTEWDWTQPCALFLGSEGEGLRRLLRERCDALVRIPLRGRIESLNVSVAAGVILYEAVRQRTARAESSYKEPQAEGRDEVY